MQYQTFGTSTLCRIRVIISAWTNPLYFRVKSSNTYFYKDLSYKLGLEFWNQQSRNQNVILFSILAQIVLRDLSQDLKK